MLKGIDPRVDPELLSRLARLGHGDLVAIVDRNFPAYRIGGAAVLPVAGLDVVGALEALLTLVPIDAFGTDPVQVMAQDDGRPSVIRDDVEATCVRGEGRPVHVSDLHRVDFYRATSEAQLVLRTLEPRPYGCLLLRVGVV
ncbi:MAG: hypothetical protein J7480_06085 [Microbacteriaceae bacterium]|nr:hypothetical protein [Microbacteriaceae bacterium]